MKACSGRTKGTNSQRVTAATGQNEAEAVKLALQISSYSNRKQFHYQHEVKRGASLSVCPDGACATYFIQNGVYVYFKVDAEQEMLVRPLLYEGLFVLYCLYDLWCKKRQTVYEGVDAHERFSPPTSHFFSFFVLV